MASALKHMLVIAPGFPDGESDTACLPFVQQMLLTFSRQYPQTTITIVTLQYPFAKQQYIWHGMQVYALGGKNKTGLSKLLVCNKAAEVCKSIHRQTPVDAILALCLCETAWVAKRFGTKYDLPFVIWMFGEDAKAGNKYFKVVKPTAEQLLPISAWQANVLQQAYGFKAKYIVNNGINRKIFPELNDATKRDIDLCAAGSLIPRKQYHIFIEVVRHVKGNGYPQVRGVLIGGGEEEAELKALSKKYAVADNIIFTGALSHTETLDWMNRSRIFVHPASYEGHSTVMLEAMYSGCDVVSFLPAGDMAMEQAQECKEEEEMNRTCLSLMSDKQNYKRALHYDMEDSAAKIYAILTQGR